MTDTKHIAFVDLAPSADGQALDEILIFPDTGSATRDGRGPFVYDGEAMAARLNAQVAAGGPLCFDYEHQLDDGEVRTGAIPAAMWGLSFRYLAGVGLLATVDWTPQAREMVSTKQYRAFSPTFYSKDLGNGTHELLRIVGGSLVNRPAFLNTWVASEQRTEEIQAADYTAQQPSEQDAAAMLATLIETLGLAAETTAEEAVAAVVALKTAADQVAIIEPELTTAREQLQTAAAVSGELQTAREQLQTATEQLAAANTELTTLRAAEQERQVEASVDGAIRARKITPAQREAMLTIARADLTAFNTAMEQGTPLVGSATPAGAEKTVAEEVVLTAAEKQFCKDYGFSEAAALKTKKARISASN